MALPHMCVTQLSDRVIVDLVYFAVTCPPLAYHGVRKIVQAIYWEEKLGLPPGGLDIIKELGYKKQKLARLMNVYYNQNEVTAAKLKLDERRGMPHTSVSVAMRNAKKDPRTQGWCLQNIVISTDYRSITTADIFYRSTEAIRKFAADLTLIKKVFEDLEVDPKPVRFYFANLYVSASFLPLFFRFTDPVKFFRHLKIHDPKFHSIACKVVSRYLNQNKSPTYHSSAKQWKIAQALDRGRIDDYLMREIPEFHERHLPR